MIKLLADANIQGQIAILASCMQVEPWREFWEHLRLCLLGFADVGLQHADADNVVWERCQALGIYLITDNRNSDGADSLESTIREKSGADSLPVFTIGDVRKLADNSDCRSSVIDRLFRYLLEPNSIRGAGRIYL